MFTHLHVHTEYSLLDGMGRIPDLVQRARELGMTSLALTDHGALHGAVEFYEAAREAGIKPIIGCEVYVAPLGRRSRGAADKQPYHLVLLAKNTSGYRNLVRLVTKAHLEGFYYKPRMDRELLEEHREGLIALSGCPTSEVPRLILEGRLEEARQAALWHRETFEDYYFELQWHEGIPNLVELNATLIQWGREMDIPLVATNDIHYTHPQDASFHDVLLCIQTNATVNDANRMRLGDESFYLKSEEEMRILFPDLDEALENTQRIAEMCELELEFGRLLLPQIALPPGKSSIQHLEELCWHGLHQRYPAPTPQQRQRLTYELDVIGQMEFADYFLVVWDIISFARDSQILFGVRGSAAASLVLYCLGITSMDPLEYGLVFERFLNLERKELPDIDLDFQDDGRDEIIDYVTRKFGKDRVAQIITFGTLGARAALRDTGRALAMTYADVDRVARMVPGGAHPTPLARVLEQVPDFRELYESDSSYRRLIDTAHHLEGIARHASTHAAGIVISKDPLIDHVPLQRPARGGDDEETAMTQWDMNTVAKAGLLKMDLLGLVNLTILARASGLIAEMRRIRLDIKDLPLDDPKTFALLASGETTGLFQLEGSGMRRYIQQLRPASLRDLSAMIALYRPGPMEHIPAFIDAKFGRAPVRYPHPDLAPILEETYGIIVYQDQVLLIVQQFAGYSLGEADTVRKAMGKKVASIMAEEEEKFLQGAVQKGYARETAQAIFHLIEPFAGYAFNKAHSVSYALIAYQTAYLKANYPVEFFTAVLNSYFGQTEKTGTVVDECHRLGIPVAPPDVSKSEAYFAIEGDPAAGTGAIRFGLGAIKNVGHQAVASLVEARKRDGPFASIEDFCRRANLEGINRRALESLIKTGALDSLGHRGALLGALDRLLSLIQQGKKLRASNQATMFDLWGDTVPVPLQDLELGEGAASPADKASWEEELTGAIFSEDPRRRALHHSTPAADVTSCADIDSDMHGQKVAVRGQVVSVRSLSTRKGEAAVAALLRDLHGAVEVVAWPELYRHTTDLWAQGNLLVVRGRVRARGDQVSITADAAAPLEIPNEAMEEPPQAEATPESQEQNLEARALRQQEAVLHPRRLTVFLRESGDEDRDLDLFQRLWDLLAAHPGPNIVRLLVEDSETITSLAVPEGVGLSSGLEAGLRDLLGAEGQRID